MTKKEEKEIEALMSAALVRDIVQRYFDSDFRIGKKDERCDFCGIKIRPDKGTIYVKNFNKKDEIPLCSSDCKDAKEYQEIQFFELADLENLPAISPKQKIPRDEIVKAYEKIIMKIKQDLIDKNKLFHKSYQIKKANEV